MPYCTVCLSRSSLRRRRAAVRGLNWPRSMESLSRVRDISGFRARQEPVLPSTSICRGWMKKLRHWSRAWKSDANPRGTETILLLEDEESLRQVTCECLTMNGYNVLQAGRGNHAVEVAEQYKGPIALIVSDVVLPDMSGPSVATKVRALHPEAKVLYVSGYAEVLVAQQLIAEGAILLQKPLSRGDLLSKVDEMLHLRNLLGSR